MRSTGDHGRSPRARTVSPMPRFATCSLAVRYILVPGRLLNELRDDRASKASWRHHGISRTTHRLLLHNRKRRSWRGVQIAGDSRQFGSELARLYCGAYRTAAHTADDLS